MEKKRKSKDKQTRSQSISLVSAHFHLHYDHGCKSYMFSLSVLTPVVFTSSVIEYLKKHVGSLHQLTKLDLWFCLLIQEISVQINIKFIKTQLLPDSDSQEICRLIQVSC